MLYVGEAIGVKCARHGSPSLRPIVDSAPGLSSDSAITDGQRVVIPYDFLPETVR